MTVKLCTRAEALDRYMTKERIEVIERAHEVGIGVFDPRDSWDRMRNYEIEHALNEDTGERWIIREWCPYDGIWCSYMEVATKADLKEALINHQRSGEYVADFVLRDLRKAIEARADLGDNDYFYQGAKAS